MASSVDGMCRSKPCLFLLVWFVFEDDESEAPHHHPSAKHSCALTAGLRAAGPWAPAWA